MSQNGVYTILIPCTFFSIAVDISAWDLLQRILDEKGYVHAHLPHDIVSWVTDESRQDSKPNAPAKIDEIEKEVNSFKQRLHMESHVVSGGSGGWKQGWKRWDDGEWVPRPIGL